MVHLSLWLFIYTIWATSGQNQRNGMCDQWRLRSAISLGIHPVWSESSLCAQWVAKDPRCRHADSEDSDQTGQMPRLIWVFAGRTCHFVDFVMQRLIWSFRWRAVSPAILSWHALCPRVFFSPVLHGDHFAWGRGSWSMCFLWLCLFILHTSISVLFLFLLVSGTGCSLWLWHCLDFSVNFFALEGSQRNDGFFFFDTAYFFSTLMP